MFAPLLASSILPQLAALQTPQRTDRCQVQGMRLLGGQAALFADRIEVTGWTWRGRYRRVVRLTGLAQVGWEPRSHPRRLQLVLAQGETVSLVLRHAGQWKFLLHQRLTDNTAEQPLVLTAAAAA